MWNQNKILVCEVNRYTKQVVNELLAKYNKVTHPDFDKELRNITGIGWKQIKNYRNHPDPSATINDNSKVKKFIIFKRKTDKYYKFKKIAVPIVFSLMVFLILFTIYKGLSNKPSEKENLSLLVKKSLEDLLGANSLHKCVKISLDKIKCPDGIYNRDGKQ